MSRANYQPVKPRVIAKQLKLPSEQQRALKLAIRRLVKAGKLSLRLGAYREAAAGAEAAGVRRSEPEVRSQRSEVRGSRTRSQGTGAGFHLKCCDHIAAEQERSDRLVSPHVQGVWLRAARRGQARRQDRRHLYRGHAHDGRRRPRHGPRATEPQPGPRQRRLLRQAGEIVEIIERDTHQFVGVYKERGGTSYVQVDGKVFAQPVPVGDPGAKGAAPNDKVVIEMVRFPTHQHAGEAVIVEVLGASGEPGVDTLSIIREFGLPEEFPEDVLEDARQQAEAFDESIGKRLDLTGETIITIDPVDARDFDDAVSLTRLDNGHWKLGVHIADVAHFVRVQSPLDREARERGTSVYLPDRVIPMLPEVISNNLASLQPDKVRYTLSALMEFTADGAYVGGEVKRSAIKSGRRFTYEEVDEFLADRAGLAEEADAGGVAAARADARAGDDLAPAAAGRGIDRADAAGGEDRPRQAGRSGRGAPGEEHREPPDDRGVHAGRQRGGGPAAVRDRAALPAAHPRAAGAAEAAGADDVRPELGIECESLESRFEIKRVIAAVAGQPEEHAVNYAVLRSMQKAVYAPTDEGHYALAQGALLPLHLADSPLSRPDGASHDRDAGPRQAAGRRFRPDGRAGRPLQRPRAAGRGGRARADEGQAAHATWRSGSASRWTRSSPASRILACSPRASSCRPRGWSTSIRWTTTSTASTARRTAWPATAAAIATAWAT